MLSKSVDCRRWNIISSNLFILCKRCLLIWREVNWSEDGIEQRADNIWSTIYSYHIKSKTQVGLSKKSIGEEMTWNLTTFNS
jgi:hypothetical protein